ncbi:MAG: tetratricopeptide repeat protein [Persephonella sp.]|nr:tetratricopeptide repeat protein [Persephonella sp.]
MNKLPEASAYFKKFLEGYGSVEKISDYAIYGLGIIDIKSGKLREAVERAGILEVRNPELAQNLYIKVAEDFADRKDFVNAFVILQKSAKTGNRYIEHLRKKIAITAYNTGNYQYAFLMFKDINQPQFLLYAGYSLLKLNRPVEAKKYFENAYITADEAETKEKALKHLADLYFQLRQFRDYLNTVKRLKKYDPEHASNLLGWYFFTKKEYKKAYLSFKDPYMKAVSAFNGNMLKETYYLIKDKKDRKFKFLLAYLYLKKEQLDRARKILKELSKGDDKIAQESGYLYAYSYFSQQEYEKAAESFRQYAQKYPDTKLGRQAVLRMADSYYNSGNTEKARAIYRQFIQRYSNSPEAIDAAYQLTILEMKSSEGDVAKQINSFLQKYPNYPFVNLLKLQLADYYLEKKEYQKAEDIYRKIANSDIKESDYALYKLGYLYYTKGDTDRAISTLKDYLKKFPRGKYTINSKTLLCKNISGKRRLRQCYKKLLKQLPDSDEKTDLNWPSYTTKEERPAEGKRVF